MARPIAKRSIATLASAIALAAIALAAGAEAPAQADRATVRYGAVPETAYAVVAEIRAKPGKADALREATLPLVAAVRNEPNNIVYFLHEDRTAPGHFIFYEIFATKADFEAHNATPHVQAWFARLPELAAGPVSVTPMQLRGGPPGPR
jgi:quinol monooxygenase YgiN